MRRFGFLLLALVLSAPAFGQVTGGFNTRMTVQANCATSACNAQSPTWCAESPYVRTAFLCNVTSGFYEPMASVDEPQSYTAIQKLTVNSVSLDRQTLSIAPGFSWTLDIVSGFNHLQPTSVEVQSGCLTYDFALYPDDDYTPGEELLMYQGQSLSLHDGAPAMLRDDDLSGEIHAKFWNRGSAGCPFRLIVTGGGF